MAKKYSRYSGIQSFAPKKNVRGYKNGGVNDPSYNGVSILTREDLAPDEQAIYDSLPDNNAKEDYLFKVDTERTAKGIKTDVNVDAEGATVKNMAEANAKNNPSSIVKSSVGSLTEAQKGAAIGTLGTVGAEVVDKTIDENEKNVVSKSVGVNTLKYAGMGATIGSAIPGVGTAVGAGVGAGVGAIIGGVQGSKKKKQYENSRIAKSTDSAFAKMGQAYKKGGLVKGKNVEKEHTKTIKDIEEKDLTVDEATTVIAKDHLKEDPKYYDKLALVEGKEGGGVVGGGIGAVGIVVPLGSGEKPKKPKKGATFNQGGLLGYDPTKKVEPNIDPITQGLKDGGLTPKKAREILHDGTIRGKKITEKQRKFFGAKSQGKSDGGEVTEPRRGGVITGPGTERSDSIKVETKNKPSVKDKKGDFSFLKEGDFVVPASHAEEAIKMRKDYLGKETKRVKFDTVSNGKADAAVSNKEVHIPKEEVAQLEKMGVDLWELAPNAKRDGGFTMKDGGIYINPENKGKFNATKKATGKTTEELTHSKNPVTKKRAVFAQNSKKWNHKADGGEVEDDPNPTGEYADGGEVSKAKEKLDRAKEALKWVSPGTGGYDKYKAEVDKAQKDYDMVVGVEKYQSKLAEGNKKKEDDSTWKSSQVDKKTVQPKTKSEMVSAALAKEKTPTTAQTAKPKASNGVADIGKVKKTTSTATQTEASKKYYEDLAKANSEPSSTAAPTVVETQGVDPAKKVSELADTSTTSTTDEVVTPKEKPMSQDSGGKKIFDALGGAAGLAALGQTAFGTIQAIKNKNKRPNFEVDTQLQAQQGEAIAQSKYGLSPEERAIMEQDIADIYKTDVKNITNLSGGSSGTALANIQGAGRGARRGLMELGATNARIKLAKQSRADQLTGEVARYKRAKFEDNLNAFNQNQQAAAGLMQAGLSNFFGNLQLREAQKREAERAKIEQGGSVDSLKYLEMMQKLQDKSFGNSNSDTNSTVETTYKR